METVYKSRLNRTKTHWLKQKRIT